MLNLDPPYQTQSAGPSLTRTPPDASRAGSTQYESGREGVSGMLHDHEMQDHSGSGDSRHEGLDVIAHQPSIPSEDAYDLSDALMHLSDVLMREMFAVSLRLDADFARAAGGPAAASAHALIAQLEHRIKELRGGSCEFEARTGGDRWRHAAYDDVPATS